MDITSAVRERFDGRAAQYDDSAMHRDLAAAVAGFVTLGPVHDVLDAATGTGLALRALRSRSADLRLTGIDLSPGMLAVARAALPGAELVEGDATALPFADASFDLVTCVTALHLIDDGDAALAEWVRVLRPAGRVVTATFQGFDPTHHHHRPGTPPPPTFPVHHDRYDSLEKLHAFAATAGLAVTRHAPWTDGHDRVLIAELGR